MNSTSQQVIDNVSSQPSGWKTGTSSIEKTLSNMITIPSFLCDLWAQKPLLRNQGAFHCPLPTTPPHPRTIRSSFPDQPYSWKGFFRPASSPVCQDTSVFVGYIRHWPISWINHSINSPEYLLIMKLRLHVHGLPICEKGGCRNCIKEMVLLGVKVLREQKWCLEPEFSRCDRRARLPPPFE